MDTKEAGMRFLALTEDKVPIWTTDFPETTPMGVSLLSHKQANRRTFTKYTSAAVA